ncbi:YceI family protein [Streptomyces chartreusis]|uniref:YceI family protein n=1 Tax=Streptomyces chartreusis TaxID=1969 RepID=UPI0033C2B332
MTSGQSGRLIGPPIPADAAAYFIDPAYSNVSFSARNRIATSTRGAFRRFAGTLFLDSERPERTALALYVTSSSIDTGEKDRDADLCSAALLDAEQYPLMSFWSSSAEAVDTNLCRLAGSLRVKNMTMPLGVDGEYRGRTRGPQGDERVGFIGRSVLRRSEWGSLWGPVVHAGEWIMGDEVEILFEVSAVKRAPIRWWP